MLKKIAVLTSIISCASIASPANVEFGRHATKSNEFTPSLSVGLSSNSDTYKSEVLKINTALYWNNPQSSMAISVKHDWSSYDGENDSNRSAFYLSNINKLGKDSEHSIEFSAGASADKFRQIDYILNAGLGYRLDLFNDFNKRANAFALGAVYEKAVEGEVEEQSNLWRLYSYWHHEQPLGDSLVARNTIAIQVSPSELDDYRIQNKLEFVNRLSDNIELGVSFEFEYDSQAFIEKYDTTRSTTLFIRSTF